MHDWPRVVPRKGNRQPPAVPTPKEEDLLCADAAPPKTNTLGTSLVPPTLPPNILPLRQDFAQGAQVLEGQIDPAMTTHALVTTSSTLAPLPPGEVSAEAVQVLAYFLTEDAKDAYDAQLNSVTSVRSLQATWKYAFHELLVRFLMNDVVHYSHHSVSGA